MVLCTCLFAQDPNRFDNVSYANWATIIFPINDGGGRTCLFLTTLFAILSVSLSPSLQRCCQGEHPFITAVPSPALQDKATAELTLVTSTNRGGHVSLYVRTCTCIHTRSAINKLNQLTLSEDITLWTWKHSTGITSRYREKGWRQSLYETHCLPHARNDMSDINRESVLENVKVYSINVIMGKKTAG